MEMQRLLLVAPYLAYMRQDIAFHPGEAVSQRIVGPFLASLFDAVVTVDPHLHRVATLHEAVPAAHTVALSGAPLLAPPLQRLLGAAGEGVEGLDVGRGELEAGDHGDDERDRLARQLADTHDCGGDDRDQHQTRTCVGSDGSDQSGYSGRRWCVLRRWFGTVFLGHMPTLSGPYRRRD